MKVMRRLRLRRGDAVAALLGCVLVAMYVSIAAAHPTPVLCAQAALSLGFVPALALWRTRVVPAAGALLGLLAAWCLAFIVATPANTGFPPYLVAAPMAVYSLTRHAPDRRLAWGALLACAAAAPASPLMWELRGPDDLRYRSGDSLLGFLALHWALLGVAFLWALHRRGEQRRREREHEAARKNERLLIAREIHDVLAHNLTLINVQSSAGIIGARTDPQAAVAALGTVRDVSAEALAQVRGIVAALRAPGAPAAEPEGPATLAEIVEGFRGLGLAVRADYPADLLSHLPAQHALAVRRITAEALTNVLRHQRAGTTVDYRLSEDASSLALTVESVGAPRSLASAASTPGLPAGCGTGLVGMRERAAALGGTLHAGPTERGWLVRAELPLGEPR
ncbi:histidine kinase [Corynebacterium mastitidis]|nr:histidine kinase [Corynebacterium mastitidis]MCH6196382.1 histidine kinase [Corynebacterium mastitidis]